MDFNSEGFASAITEAIKAYAEFTGMDAREVALECQTMDGPVYEVVAMMVFAVAE